MKFSEWINKKINENKKPQPVQMPNQTSNKISIDPGKDRIPGGRKNTFFDSRPKRLRTRGSQNRKELQDKDY